MLDNIEHFDQQPDRSPQGIFNAAYIGVMIQGRDSRKGTGSWCAYRGDNGAKCAVGHLIDDEMAAAWDAKSNSGISTIARSGRAPEWVRANLELLSELQDAHDGYVWHCAWHCNKSFRKYFHDECKDIASRFGLTMPPLDWASLEDVDARLYALAADATV